MNLELPPHWYSGLSVAVSLYQSVRGGWFQHLHVKRESQKSKGDQQIGCETKTQVWILRIVADAIFYFVTTLAGFASLLITYRVAECIQSLQSVSVGSATLLIALSLFGILGITGKLPDLIHQARVSFSIK